MSTFATNWAKQQRAGSTRAKYVLDVIADYADEAGHCFPSIVTIARITEQSRKSVERCLTLLEERGLIKIEPRFDDTGRRTSNGYYLLAPAELLRGASKLHRPKPPPQTAAAAKAVPEAVENSVGGIRQVDVGPRQPDGGVCDKADGGYATTVSHAESSEPSDEPSELKEPARARAPAAPHPVDDAHWDAFWTAYPHPAGDPSKLAHEEWLAIIENGGDGQAIAEAAKAYARGKRRSEWSVQAVRWLREGRWGDWVKASSSIALPTEPKIASNVSASDRAWLHDRWSALLRQIGAHQFMFVDKLIIVDIGEQEIRLTAPNAFLRDYARDQLGIALQRAFGRPFIIDLASLPQAKGKVA